VTLTTHQAAKEMGLEPIPGLPLDLMGVGDSQKTRSTVRYKIPMFDTGGRMVEVAAYGVDHIMAPLEAVDSMWMRAVFPEALTGELEAASGRVDLLIGKNILKLFPVERRRVENSMLHRSRFGTGWIASGRPPGLGDPATGAEKTTSARVRTSAEAATDAEEATSAEAATGAEEATSAGAATGMEEAISKGKRSTKRSQLTSLPWKSQQSRQTGSMSSSLLLARYSSRSQRSQRSWRSRKSQETWRSRKSRETWRSWRSTEAGRGFGLG
jgi:hypothetical protein